MTHVTGPGFDDALLDDALATLEATLDGLDAELTALTTLTATDHDTLLAEVAHDALRAVLDAPDADAALALAQIADTARATLSLIASTTGNDARRARATRALDRITVAARATRAQWIAQGAA
ncbi:hypothetical protein [Rhodococcus sp. 11-3]|uniref:hypothetical protein n=1 Tax=Rhodococcus sp. 11-3 TaxID=2854796 RepID=UPI00203B58D1|nr:hypothetical protein [Rhodococcus sp. 11-3]USC18458.1 hypothetical protein KZJ41_28240 [Rhodococcus sp. 11-3]